MCQCKMQRECGAKRIRDGVSVHFDIMLAYRVDRAQTDAYRQSHLVTYSL